MEDIKKREIPETVGDFIEMLKAYPPEAKVSMAVEVIYDNGSRYDEDRYHMTVDTYDYGSDKVQDVIITVKS